MIILWLKNVKYFIAAYDGGHCIPNGDTMPPQTLGIQFPPPSIRGYSAPRPTWGNTLNTVATFIPSSQLLIRVGKHIARARSGKLSHLQGHSPPS